MFTAIPRSALPGGQLTAWALDLLALSGLVAAGVAWTEASATVRVERQVDWAALGVAGAAAVGLAATLRVAMIRQAVTARLRSLVAPTEGARLPSVVRGDAVAAAGSGAVTEGGVLVAAANMARYHRSLCPLVAGKQVRPGTRVDHEAAGRQACGVCEP